MRIAIVETNSGFDKVKISSSAIVPSEIAKESRFLDDIKLFSSYTPNPFSIGEGGIDILPKCTQENFKQKVAILTERLARYKPDIIEVHSGLKLPLSLAKTLPYIPVVHYSHNATEFPYPHRKRLLRRIRRVQSLIQLDYTIHVSHFARKQWLTRMPSKIIPLIQKRNTTIQNALRAERWLADGSKKEKIILFSGRPYDTKGIDLLIEALQQVLPKYPDWKVVFLAHKANDDFQSEQKSIAKKTLKEQCLWLEDSQQDKIQEWTKKASIAVIPSNYDENFSLAALEFHYASCAVISSGRGALPEISGADGALYLDEVSPKDIAAKLNFLIENDTEREALAKRGHEYVMETHDIKKRAHELDELRLKIIARAKEERKNPRQWRAAMRRKKWYVIKKLITQKKEHQQ